MVKQEILRNTESFKATEGLDIGDVDDIINIFANEFNQIAVDETEESYLLYNEGFEGNRWYLTLEVYNGSASLATFAMNFMYALATEIDNHWKHIAAVYCEHDFSAGFSPKTAACSVFMDRSSDEAFDASFIFMKKMFIEDVTIFDTMDVLSDHGTTLVIEDGKGADRYIDLYISKEG